MLHSFKWKIALFSLATSGAIFVIFAALFMTLVRRIDLERIDRHLQAITEAQLRRPPPQGQWDRFDASLAAMYGDERPRQFLIMVTDPFGKALYTSERWPKALTADALGILAYLRQVQRPGERPPPLMRRPARPPEEDGPPPEIGEPRGQGPQNRPPRPGRDGEEPPAFRMPLKRPLFLTTEIEGRPWRLIVMGSNALGLVVAADLADFRAELSRRWQTVAVAGPLALLLLAAGGWLLAGRALRPVRILTEVAAGITAKGLDRRVQTPGADHEFQALTDVINGMLDRLEKSFHQAARFSADAAHELKTPLTILQGQLEQAVQQAASASKEQQTYAGLLEEVQRLKGIVRKLLLLAQSDSGQLRLSLEAIDLDAELEALFEDLPLMAPGLSLEKDLACGARVLADPDLLRQVLQNLFSNAAKYNRADGRIACRLRHGAGTVTLTLANTTPPGVRIDKSRLFDRFYRGDPARNREIEGCGLGLSLAREISRAHGGELVLDESETRDGWIAFRLTWPEKPA